MSSCAGVHKEFDRFANRAVQSGELPEWLHVSGPVAWYVYQGSYGGIGAAFPRFIRDVEVAFPGRNRGPPGDVYVCSPAEHLGAREKTLTTIFWTPLG